MLQQAACQTCLPGPGKPGAKLCVIKKERGASVSPKKGGTAKSKAFSSFLQGREGLFVYPFRRREMPWRKTES
ncbi:hypothetical protein B4098_2974 [Heyndrickxia coagulans]|uniref:Uncharacterized protein n=1 Tax=Heyndrickxia coagulans TaxID=1398 RepID=A0A150JTU9_HEYCO|nr:hypothetical protein B4100_3361 [Heyndrickxia coagulans]KYC60730.1 hypothetical protein B4098_2974 [Heyndrickxia coagulans]KYC60900.1 hypothetical protein B4099_3327 [Heyndrickxia coagulans]